MTEFIQSIRALPIAQREAIANNYSKLYTSLEKSMNLVSSSEEVNAIEKEANKIWKMYSTIMKDIEKDIEASSKPVRTVIRGAGAKSPSKVYRAYSPSRGVIPSMVMSPRSPSRMRSPRGNGGGGGRTPPTKSSVNKFLEF
jgi:hypothetical protein